PSVKLPAFVSGVATKSSSFGAFIGSPPLRPGAPPAIRSAIVSTTRHFHRIAAVPFCHGCVTCGQSSLPRAPRPSLRRQDPLCLARQTHVNKGSSQQLSVSQKTPPAAGN